MKITTDLTFVLIARAEKFKFKVHVGKQLS